MRMTRADCLPIAIALLAVTLLLFGVIPAVSGAASAHYALGFADDYDQLALSLVNGAGYRLGPGLGETMLREPGYPLFLAGVFALLDYGIEAARVANLALAAAAALLLWHLAVRITCDRRIGTVAVLLFLFHPGTLIALARGGVELLFITAVLAFLLLLYRALDTQRAAPFLLAGLALGAAVLIRSTPVLLPVVLIPCLIFLAPAGTRARRLLHGAALAAGMLMAISPWILRNYALSGQFVPTATVQGVAAQEGQYTCERMPPGRRFQALQREAAAQRNETAAGLGLRFKPGYYQYFYSAMDELAFNRALLASTAERYREHPELLARCAAANLLNFWFLGKNGLATSLNLALQLPLLVLVVAGLVVVHRRHGFAVWAPVGLFIAYVVGVHAPVIAHARHSVPLMPLLAIFAAAALLFAWRRLFAARVARRTPGADAAQQLAGV